MNTYRKPASRPTIPPVPVLTSTLAVLSRAWGAQLLRQQRRRRHLPPIRAQPPASVGCASMHTAPPPIIIFIQPTASILAPQGEPPVGGHAGEVEGQVLADVRGHDLRHAGGRFLSHILHLFHFAFSSVGKMNEELGSDTLAKVVRANRQMHRVRNFTRLPTPPSPPPHLPCPGTTAVQSTAPRQPAACSTLCQHCSGEERGKLI